jgi:hypothetical protein
MAMYGDAALYVIVAFFTRIGEYFGDFRKYFDNSCGGGSGAGGGVWGRAARVDCIGAESLAYFMV